MLKLLLLPLACCLHLAACAQYWQQQTDYILDVTLHEKEKTLDAFEKLTYFNNSPDTLRFIWFHLWPNAYKNDRTAFSDQALENGRTDFYFSGKEERGYINRLDFKVDGMAAKTEDHPEHIDIIKLILPRPLAPKAQVSITTPFHVKLPYNFSRGGYDKESFQLTQWYPKPAVYDSRGWHAMPYLDQGEFYSEFGSYDVRITLPSRFVVAATGSLQDEEEKQWLRTRTKAMATPVKKAVPAGKALAQPAFPADATKTLHYKQDRVHDFALFANKDFIVASDTCMLGSGRIIDVQSFYTFAEAATWKNSLQNAKDALRFYSAQIGEYPFDVASVVQGPQSFGGGMEYPTITVISPVGSSKLLDEVIAHELGHNWFYGMLASNEREHPWMDEGMNTFYEERYMRSKYGQQTSGIELLYETKAAWNTDQPIETTSEKFSEVNYGLTAYYKTAEWMKGLEQKLGTEKFRQMMQAYFKQWQFRHPYPEDFRAVASGYLGTDTDAVFALLQQRGILPNNKPKGFLFVSPLKKGSIKAYIQQPAKNMLLASPAIGSNSYDRLMLGGLITNYKLPPSRFQFLLAPMYGTGSKKFTGLGKLNYSIISRGSIRKTDLFLNGADFSMNEFKDSAGRKLFMQFQKLVPGIRLTFRENDPRSTVHTYIQWKTFLIREQSLRIVPDTAITGGDTSLFLHYYLPRKSRYLNQLQLVLENDRALYPYHFMLQVEQAKDFIRPALTADYFFNYRNGGMQLRFFAGKFIYLGERTLVKQFANDRYFLNMTGANGYEDYTYSDYFIGRNRFENFESQQIMIRDGGFKVRSDLLASKIGKTDNWLLALNLNTSIPEKINPLSVLPVKIPLHIFADIGTYAEAWDRNSESDRFLYDIGLHLPLFNEFINFYFPVLYNKSYRDYFKSTIPKNRFFKTMSFSVHLYTKEIRKINRELEF